MGSERMRLIRERGHITAPSSVQEGKYLHMVMSMFRISVARTLSVITALPCHHGENKENIYQYNQKNIYSRGSLYQTNWDSS